jgi:NADH dehydrogenase [ubiquinone] 1 alpha subcomplex assembly factor 7
VLEELIKQEIREKGAMSIARYMELCLFHSSYGYYSNNDPLGKDFTTSPEISQIFGECVGIWVLLKWQAMGSPSLLNLIELGPGRSKFKVNFNIHLVEINQALREKQSLTLAGLNVSWYQDIYEIKAFQNSILIANEFLDCLPIQQYIDGVERFITLKNDALTFSSDGEVREICPSIPPLLSHLPATHALFIDYGGEGVGDTLQAMKEGKYVSPLTLCGQADLTAHVNFKEMQLQAENTNFTTRLSTQRKFLLEHGFEARFNALKDPKAFRLIENALPTSMGVLFKVLELSRP